MAARIVDLSGEWDSLSLEKQDRFFCLAGAGHGDIIKTPSGYFGISGNLRCTHPAWMYPCYPMPWQIAHIHPQAIPSLDLAKAAHTLYAYQEGIRTACGHPGLRGVSVDTYRQHLIQLKKYVAMGGSVEVALESAFKPEDESPMHRTLMRGCFGEEKSVLVMKDGQLYMDRGPFTGYISSSVQLHGNSVDNHGREEMVYVNFPQNSETEYDWVRLGRIRRIQTSA